MTTLACKQQSTLPPVTQAPAAAQSQAAIPNADQSALIRQLEDEKRAAQRASDELSLEISRLEGQLESNSTASDADKAALSAEIDRLKAEQDAKLAEVAKLEEEKKALEEQIKKLEEENKKLQDELKKAKEGQQSTADAGNTAGQIIQNRIIFSGQSCLGVDAKSTANNALIKAQACDNSAFQRYNAEMMANGQMLLMNRGSAKCFYVEGASSNDGAKIQQQDCRRNGDTSGVFKFTDVQGFDFKIQNVRSGKCVKIQASGELTQQDCATGATLFRWAVGN